MPELRGGQATAEIKEEWKRAYDFYREAPGDRYDKKKDRTDRITYVAEKMNLTRKQRGPAAPCATISARRRSEKSKRV
ncbi:MAG: hypothetical protein LC802_10225 [Acidobacteria bacterium]|nr:hypothetical protein [Acidobacteriota bacterium]